MSSIDRVPATADTNAKSQENRAQSALDLMKQALQLIDDNDGPDDAGAYLDQAIHRLENFLSGSSSKSE